MSLYLEPHQSLNRKPTQYENLLGDSIERAFGQGIKELAELVAYLNNAGPSPQVGDIWTDATFETEMARLGN
ncbi:hypothetical protein AiwAL_16490 [Acidiphilium sp. AL]|uniref:Recombinase-like domain-containing protein n=2 Tax=Acidiphilium TaxID=522 RepID=A0ABS9DZL4_9PROT|nr:recombinase-like helix-turn-helix domain-containing protein [Acidiphilium iwatense]MCF3948203.1 hypothetical protein [Acidiphilium iwatense]MCU4161680.1 hypothetical protein [Acidiphilium sp. AL]